MNLGVIVINLLLWKDPGALVIAIPNSNLPLASALIFLALLLDYICSWSLFNISVDPMISITLLFYKLTGLLHFDLVVGSD
jgi:hypothetical protein